MRAMSEERLMRVRFGLALAVAACAFAVAGCGGGGSTSASSSAGGGGGPISVQANATPTPSPTPTPGPLTVTPNQLFFTVVGQVQPFSVYEAGYQGTFTAAAAASSLCTGKATFSPATAIGPNPTFTVTSVAGGTCVIDVTDAYGQEVQVTVFVTITNATVSSTKRN
jgi:hypothetical protein